MISVVLVELSISHYLTGGSKLISYFRHTDAMIPIPLVLHRLMNRQLVEAM